MLVFGVILISIISFGAGRLTSQSKDFGGFELQVVESPSPSVMVTVMPLENNKPIETDVLKSSTKSDSVSGGIAPSPTPTPTPKIQIIGNKNSKIYHYPWCSGAKNMKEENKVIFNTIEEAKSAGYRPAGNCPGLN